MYDISGSLYICETSLLCIKEASSGRININLWFHSVGHNMIIHRSPDRMCLICCLLAPWGDTSGDGETEWLSEVRSDWVCFNVMYKERSVHLCVCPCVSVCSCLAQSSRAQLSSATQWTIITTNLWGTFYWSLLNNMPHVTLKGWVKFRA